MNIETIAYLLQSVQTEQQTTHGLTSLEEKAIIAVVSAVLSLIGGYILLQIKERREAHKRLLYDLDVRKVVAVDDVIAKDIGITYKNSPANQLSFVSCQVQNSGNRVVKQQSLRFDFGEAATVVDAYLDPQPPTEYGVDEVFDPALPKSERKFTIKHLEREQSVGFRFVVSGTLESEVRIHPFNEEGDVDVLPGTIAKARDDRVALERFIVLFLLGMIIPPIFYRVPDQFIRLGSSLISLLIALALLPLIRPTARVISIAISALARRVNGPAVEIENLHQEPTAELSIVVGTTASLLRHASAPTNPPL